MARRPVVLDMDSSESPVHGAQEGSAYNGHSPSASWFTEHGDCLAATLRRGNVHSSWDDLLLPEIERQQSASAWRSALTPRSPSRRSTTSGDTRRGLCPFACRRTRAWSWRSRTDGRAASPWCATRVFAIRRRAPRRLQVETTRVSRSSRVDRSSGSTTSAARRSNGSRKASRRRIGPLPNEVRLQLSVLAYNVGNLGAVSSCRRGSSLVADESPAAASENRGPAGEACAVLLAPAGRASDPATVRRHARRI